MSPAILIDTHVFVWALSAPQKVPTAAWPYLRDPHQKLLLSVASAWELAIKAARGKITLRGGVGGFVGEGCRKTGVALLGIDLAHTVEVQALPHHHRDPFDRMLIAQARVDDLAVLSYDRLFDAYDIERVGV